jgi:hypothetical protein
MVNRSISLLASLTLRYHSGDEMAGLAMSTRFLVICETVKVEIVKVSRELPLERLQLRTLPKVLSMGRQQPIRE